MPNNPIKNNTFVSTTAEPLTLLEYLKAIKAENEEIIEHNEDIDTAVAGCAKKNESNIFKNTNFFYGWFLARGGENNPDWGQIESVSGIVSMRTFNPNTNVGYSLFVHPYAGVGARITYNRGEQNEYVSTFNFPTKPQGTYTLATTDDIPEPSGSSLLEDIKDNEGHYAFETYEQEEAPVDTTPLYVKGLRNGNVLTLVCCTKVSNAQNVVKLVGYIKLPSYILNKLILGQYEGNMIGQTNSSVYVGGSTTDVTTQWFKENDGVSVYIRGLSAFAGGNIRGSLILGL